MKAPRDDKIKKRQGKRVRGRGLKGGGLGARLRNWTRRNWKAQLGGATGRRNWEARTVASRSSETDFLRPFGVPARSGSPRPSGDIPGLKAQLPGPSCEAATCRLPAGSRGTPRRDNGPAARAPGPVRGNTSFYLGLPPPHPDLRLRIGGRSIP
jgi:hypothetical protein